MKIDKTLYDRLGGIETLNKVHKIFYDKIYAHNWLKQYFAGKPQHVIEEQQTDFMVQLMGGPKVYSGKSPKSAHQHMLITEELFEERSKILSESINQAGVADNLRQEWLAADAALKKSLIKRSINDCSVAYPTQAILNFPK